MAAPTDTLNIAASDEGKYAPRGDDICQDVKTLVERQKVLGKQRQASMYFSIGESFQFLGGLMLTVGMSIVGAAIGTAGQAGVMAALATTTGTIGLAMLGTALAATAVAVSSKYMGARYASNANFDQSIVNAHQTARSLSRKHLHVTVEYPENKPPSNGKSWVQVACHNHQPHMQTQEGATIGGR